MKKNKFEKTILKLIISAHIFLLTQCKSTQKFNSDTGYQSDIDRTFSELKKRQESEIIKFDYTNKYRPH